MPGPVDGKKGEPQAILDGEFLKVRKQQRSCYQPDDIKTIPWENDVGESGRLGCVDVLVQAPPAIESPCSR